MTFPAIIGFCVAMLILAASPGPGVFATVGRSLASGFKDTLPLICGIILGDILYLLFAVFGLSYIAQTMGKVFMIVKLLGGSYLIYLGITIWRSDPTMHLQKNLQATPPLKNFVSGLLITLSNPKVIIFYCGFLPTFVDLATLGKKDIILIAALVTIVLATVLCAYSLAAGRTRQLFTGSKAMRNLNRTAGSVMAIAGVLIATKN
jgi:threonine/homoserine/homoserine lactone efflux protein